MVPCSFQHERLKKQKQYAHILTLHYLCEVIWNQGKYILLFLARSQGGYKLNTAKIIGTVPVHTHHTCKKLEKIKFALEQPIVWAYNRLMILRHLKRKRRKKGEKRREGKTKVRMCVLSTHTASKSYFFFLFKCSVFKSTLEELYLIKLNVCSNLNSSYENNRTGL